MRSGLEAPTAHRPLPLLGLHHGLLGTVKKQGFLLDPSRAAVPGAGVLSPPQRLTLASLMALWLLLSGTRGSLTLK